MNRAIMVALGDLVGQARENGASVGEPHDDRRRWVIRAMPSLGPPERRRAVLEELKGVIDAAVFSSMSARQKMRQNGCFAYRHAHYSVRLTSWVFPARIASAKRPAMTFTNAFENDPSPACGSK